MSMSMCVRVCVHVYIYTYTCMHTRVNMQTDQRKRGSGEFGVASTCARVCTYMNIPT